MKQPFDDTAKSYYRRFFEERGISAIPQYEVFSRGRAIDLVVECTDENLRDLQKTAFAHFRRLNVVEFKGLYDPLTAINVNLIMMRAWGVGAVDDAKKSKAKAKSPRIPTKELAEMPTQRTVTIICVTRPDRVLDHLHAEFQFEPTDEPGIYCDNSHKIPVWIIHPTSLALTERNYPLLSLARGKKLAQFVELCLEQGLIEYLQLMFDIGLAADPDVIWHKIMEMIGMKVTIRDETWPYVDEFFRKVPEAMDNVPYIRDAFQAVQQQLQEAREQAQKAQQQAEQESLKAERERVKAEQERVKAEQERVKAEQTSQRTLLRVLSHKFGELPDDIVSLVRDTTDREQLELWLDNALEADTLAAMKW